MKQTTQTYQVGNNKLELITRKRLTIFGYITEWRWKAIGGNNRIIGTSHPEWFKNRLDCVSNFLLLGEIATEAKGIDWLNGL